MNRRRPFLTPIISLAILAFSGSAILTSASAQEPAKPSMEKPPGKPATPATPENPAQIELLETRIRFEADGSSRKEVHARARINSELGVRQFARLNFDYNRSFESIEIPLVHITHPSGGTADMLPSAITDQPNPAVVDAPAYHNVRVKSVRILGLQPGDTLEYRVVSTVSHHPLAPDLWLDHSFDRTGVVSEELFQVDFPTSVLAPAALIVVKNASVIQELESRLGPVPGCGFCIEPLISEELDPSEIDSSRLPLLLAKPKQPKHAAKPAKPTEPAPLQTQPDAPVPTATYGKVQLFVKPSLSAASIQKSGEDGNARVSYTWQQMTGAQESDRGKDSPVLEDLPDVLVGKNSRWPWLSFELYSALQLPDHLPEEVTGFARQMTQGDVTPVAKTERIYDFVSQKIRTIDLPLGTTQFQPRPVGEILSSGYAIPEDKFFLFEALAQAVDLEAGAVLVGPSKKVGALVASPAAFNHLLISVPACECWLDPGLEVAPFRMIPSSYRGSAGLSLGIDSNYLVDLPDSSMSVQIPNDLPFTSSQKVLVNASVDSEGNLTAKVHYSLRGDNELLLRVAFHQTPKEKWKELAQMLSLSDGFRGQVTYVNASDPYATKEPFSLDYEITMTKLVDWSKKPVRIPALLPQVGLPDSPAKLAAGAKPLPIELGTPLEVTTSMTLQLPRGTTVQPPTGTSVSRDYATLASQYAAKGQTITASRHINFLLREIPADRAADYNAFLRAVQNDEAQDFTLERKATTPPDAKPATPKPSTAPKP